jgi:hypothetical protein
MRTTGDTCTANLDRIHRLPPSQIPTCVEDRVDLFLVNSENRYLELYIFPKGLCSECLGGLAVKFKAHWPFDSVRARLAAHSTAW